MIDIKGEYGNTLDEIEKMILDFHHQWSIYDENSLLYKMNHTNEFVNLDIDTEDIIKKAMLYYDETQGYFDVTTCSLNLLWKEAIKNKKVPSRYLVKKYKNNHIHHIVLNNGQIKLTHSCQIDLVGLAKGYILNRVVAKLRKNNICEVIVNLGGSIHIHKRKGFR